MILATPVRSYKIVAVRKPYPAGVRTQVGGGPSMARARKEAKFEVFGQEMVEKIVAKSGSSGRVYLPPNWIGKRVKVIRVD
jgi:putative transposon-encoded protein